MGLDITALREDGTDTEEDEDEDDEDEDVRLLVLYYETTRVIVAVISNQ